MKRILLIIFLITTLLSCHNRQQPERGSRLKKYVYIDWVGVLHTKNGCKAVYKDHSMQQVRPILVADLELDNLNKICSQCVTEEQIDSLIALIRME